MTLTRADYLELACHSIHDATKLAGLIKTARAVLEEVQNDSTDNWNVRNLREVAACNPDFHIEVTLTVTEILRLVEAFRRPRRKKKNGVQS